MYCLILRTRKVALIEILSNVLKPLLQSYDYASNDEMVSEF